MKMLRIVTVDVVRESRTFSGHQLIGCIARSSLRLHSFLVHNPEIPGLKYHQSRDSGSRDCNPYVQSIKCVACPGSCSEWVHNVIE